jgi:hypothetical protein
MFEIQYIFYVLISFAIQIPSAFSTAFLFHHHQRSFYQNGKPISVATSLAFSMSVIASSVLGPLVYYKPLPLL